MVADKYVHIEESLGPFMRCRYAVVESKGRSVKRALEQLEETIHALRRYGHDVHYAIIELRRPISRYEQKLFTVRNHMLHMKHGRDVSPVRIDHVQVYVIYK